MSGTQTNTLRVSLLFLFVCLAGALVGGFFGSLAPMLYSLESPRTLFTGGLVLGGVGGFLAGVLWCLSVLSRVRETSSYWSVVGRGALNGLLVGILATVILHAGLMVVATRWMPEALLGGLLFGVPAGLVVGAFCGMLVWVIWQFRRGGEAGQ